MLKFAVSVQVIKTYIITIEASNEDSAITQANNTDAPEITSSGNLTDIAVDHAKVLYAN